MARAHSTQPPRWDEARRRSHEVVAQPTAPQVVALADGVGRILAEDHLALTDLPAFTTSAMDGWAVCGSGPWQVVGEVLAGRPAAQELSPGQAVVIATGAVIPDGTLGVVRREWGELEERGGRAWFSASPPEPDAECRPAGEEARLGEILGSRGTRVSPALVGLLAAAGHDTLQVRARPRAGLLIFGDELLDSGLPQSGAIRDSLGPQLPGWLAALGIEVVVQRRVEDTAAAHTAAIADALDSCDVIFTTGGTAAGPVDHLHRAIAETGGRLVVDSVACRPGHPMLLAAFESGEGTEPAQRRYLVGLPGNPQSAIVALLTLGAPLVDALLGREMPDLPLVSLTADLRAPRTEDRLVLGQVRSGEFFAVAHLGSGMLRGLAAADGFAIIPPGTVAAGARVPWLPLPQS